MSLPTPNALFDLARKSTVVNSWLQLWRNGDVTLEQALIGALVSLHDVNENLLEQVTHFHERNPAPFIAKER